MTSSGIIDLAIGMTFVFGVTAALSSVATELIARFLGLRGAYLLRGLRELLDGEGVQTDLTQVLGDYAAMRTFMKGKAPARAGTGVPADTAASATQPAGSATGALLGSPILRSQGMTGQIFSRKLTLHSSGPNGGLVRLTANEGERLWRACRGLPSYISARSFSEALMDLVVPDATGQTAMDTVSYYVNGLPNSMPTLKASLQALVTNAGNDIALFRTSVENWYDDHMTRVSGWYKRHVAKITIVVGSILVLLLNVNTLTVGRALYNDSTVRTAVTSVAARTASCNGQSQQTCLADLQARLSAVAQAGLPIGWAAVPDCAAPNTHCNWLDQRGIFSRHGGSGWQVVLVLIGFLITIMALTPGARFWFDLLGKLGSLRTSGPKPAPPAS